MNLFCDEELCRGKALVGGIFSSSVEPSAEIESESTAGDLSWGAFVFATGLVRVSCIRDTVQLAHRDKSDAEVDGLTCHLV